MKLQQITEVQYKTSLNSINRANASGVLGTASINDVFEKPKKRRLKDKKLTKSLIGEKIQDI